MADEVPLARLWQEIAAWNRWQKERGIVLRQRCTSAFQWVWGTAAPAGRQGWQTITEIGRKTLVCLYAMPWQAMASRHWKLLLLIVAIIMVGSIWKVPQWQAASWEGLMEAKDLAKLQNDARITLVQTFGGAVLLIGLYFTLRNLQLTQDKQITEHYTRAVEHLGGDKLEVRLGAIYAFERIARDSERDHWPIMEILTACVREHASWKGEGRRSQPVLALDIQAILTVLGRRTRTYGKGEDHRLNLARTDLCGANLASAHLEGAHLRETHLERALLWNARLEGALLRGAHLEGAFLSGARLNGTDLCGAHLEGAEGMGVNLEGGDLRDAHLERASLIGVNLMGVKGLTVEQLASTKTLYMAHLDPPFLEKIQQQYPHLLEEASIYKT